MGVTHFCFRIGAHGDIEEFFVEERHAAFYAPGRETLVGTQTVVEVELAELAHGFFVEGFGIGCFVEIEVAAENLVGTFAAEHHLDTHRFDDACQQVHRCGGTDGGDIVGFNEIDDITDGVEPFLNGVVDLVVHGADMIGDEFGFCQVGGTFQSYGKRVQTRPVGTSL